MNDAVNHPEHYGGEDNPYEAIKVIDAWDLSFCLGNAVKYIARAGRKSVDGTEDLCKARWYLDHEIKRAGGPPLSVAEDRNAAERNENRKRLLDFLKSFVQNREASTLANLLEDGLL